MYFCLSNPPILTVIPFTPHPPPAPRMTRDNCDIGVDALTGRLTASRVRSQLLQVPNTHQWLLFHSQRLSLGRFNNYSICPIFFWKSSPQNRKMYIVILTMIICKDHHVKCRLKAYACMLRNAYFELQMFLFLQVNQYLKKSIISMNSPNCITSN